MGLARIASLLEGDEGPEFESWRMRLVFQFNTDISRSDWRLCPIGQHLINLIVDIVRFRKNVPFGDLPLEISCC